MPDPTAALPPAPRGAQLRAARRAPSASARAATVPELDTLISGCRACPRLVAWREETAQVRRAAFADQVYWGRPVPGFGPEDASVLLVGLAPAAHGANRTGRMFTGDRSGDVLFAALHALGMATAARAVSSDDGLALIGIRLSSPVRCAPPQNRPTPTERRACAPFLARELELLTSVRVAVVLGAFGWQALLSVLADGGWRLPRPRPKFGHGAQVAVTHPSGRRLILLGCFHVSQHNTFTGRLTPAMVEQVLRRAKALAANGEGSTMAKVRVKRVYEAEAPDDGERVLVDRLWPRGVKKENASWGRWCKDVAPSNELRKWYGHDPDKYNEFARRYRTELADPDPAAALDELKNLAAAGPLTLLTASKAEGISQAHVLAELLST